jgi:hypothetical protein
VVRDQVLGSANQLDELADATVGASQLGHELPPVPVGDQLEEPSWRYVHRRIHGRTLHQSALMRNRAAADRGALPRRRGRGGSIVWGGRFDDGDHECVESVAGFEVEPTEPLVHLVKGPLGTRVAHHRLSQ